MTLESPPLNVPMSDSGSAWTAPEGFHFEWEPEDGARAATAEEYTERKCRRPRCGGRPVMAFMRSNGWWLYCADHLYGRRITGGIVEWRKLVPDEPDA